MRFLAKYVRFVPNFDRDRYDENGELEEKGHPQFVLTNEKYVNRKGIETKDGHLTRSFAATQKGGICRMGTMDIEWLFGELDK